MRKLKIIEHISLDGVIQAPGGPNEDGDYPYGGWAQPYRDAAGMQAVLEAHGDRFDLLLGRHTYDIWSAYWPTAGGNPFADNINAATKYVVTHRPQSLAWGPHEGVGQNLTDDIRRIKSQDGPNLITWGSSQITPKLLEYGLVDEVMLLVYPLLLGKGKRFFSEAEPAHKLKLVDSKAIPSGVVLNTYKSEGSL